MDIQVWLRRSRNSVEAWGFLISQETEKNDKSKAKWKKIIEEAVEKKNEIDIKERLRKYEKLEIKHENIMETNEQSSRAKNKQRT